MNQLFGRVAVELNDMKSSFILVPVVIGLGISI
jgi:hypothetical protein